MDGPHPKRCSLCQRILPSSAFYWSPSRPTGSGPCRECDRARQAARRARLAGQPDVAAELERAAEAQRQAELERQAEQERAVEQARQDAEAARRRAAAVDVPARLTAIRASIDRDRQAAQAAAAARRGLLTAGHGVVTVDLPCCVPESWDAGLHHSRSCPVRPRRPVRLARQAESPARTG
ncbi:MAG: hypothetical protein ACLQDY_08315 [Streptosporangiaceae bacterium]